jgi:hypothetical protein
MSAVVNTTQEHEDSDLVEVCTLNDFLTCFVVLPHRYHISLTKRLRPYIYMNISAYV